MKALVITGSRADRNGLEVVYEALLEAGHESRLIQTPIGPPIPFGWDDGGNGSKAWCPDVALLGGDRIEILEAAVELASLRIPIAHLAGGDRTEGSADDRYRDAITALSCIHFATNNNAFNRLTGGDYIDGPLEHEGDSVHLTGSPAIDRIRQTPISEGNRSYVLSEFCMRGDKPIALVCVHSNTVGPKPLADAWAVAQALRKLEMQCICLGANADRGGEEINAMWRDWCISTNPMRSFHENVPPFIYYSLMTYCDVMVGNSSAMLYEAPCFGLPCVLVGDRQKGRMIPSNVTHIDVNGDIAAKVIWAMAVRPDGGVPNPYGDGHSAPRIVKALEENEWRWRAKVKQEAEVKL